jgi:hypothetical protein
MKLLLVGDSWGCGEWDLHCTSILHTGLEQYLLDDGHQVDNISYGGISNLDIVNRISGYLELPNKLLPNLILVFQTEYSRDYKHDKIQKDFGCDDWQDLTTVEDLTNKWVERFYFRLSEISSKFSIPIKIIGGCSDTFYFDNMSKDYPGCDIVCQSIVNLILTGDHRISTPIFSWYTKKITELVKKLYEILPLTSIDDLESKIDQGFKRECLLRECPEFFYPDGIHPNRFGHKILFDFLKASRVFG